MESDRRILLLGPVGSGKSSTGNSLIGFPVFQILTKTCAMIRHKSEIINRYLWIVDTPGFCSRGSSPRDWAIEILRYLEECTFKPHAVMLIFNLNDGGADQQQMISMLKLAFGEQVFRHCIVVITHSDAVIWNEESSLLQMVVDKCNGRSTRINNSASNVPFNIPTEDVRRIMVMVDQVSTSGANMFSPQIERRKVLEKCGSDEDLDAIVTSVEEQIRKMKFTPRVKIIVKNVVILVVATGVVFYCMKKSMILKITEGITAREIIENRNLLLEKVMEKELLEKLLPACPVKPIPDEYESALQTGINLINSAMTTALLTSALLKKNPFLLIAGMIWGFGAAATTWITKM